MTFPEISKGHKVNPLRLLFHIVTTFHGLVTEAANCSVIFGRKNVIGQKLKENGSHQILKAFYNVIVDGLHYEQRQGRI